MNDYVIVIMVNDAGEEVFDRIVYFPGQEMDRIEHKVNMLRSIGYKAKYVEMPIEHFNPNHKWDVFLAYAMAYGIPFDLAMLGRECIRNAEEHNWDVKVRIRYHLLASGRTMIQSALREPDKTKEIWSCLIRTDGKNCG